MRDFSRCSRCDALTAPAKAFNGGDKVIYEGKVYESIIDANIWSPSEHPQGWQEIN